ncbi:hypothetical protein TNCV_4117641 [Trichonephila clavipes]|nr:hypothetical protein TNCV_4117641 [Trichonephila clavipes]
MGPWVAWWLGHRTPDRKAWFTCRNCGGGDRGRVAIYRPFGEFRRAKIALSPVWCSRPTTGVPLAHATMNFVGLDLTTSDSYKRSLSNARSIAFSLRNSSTHLIEDEDFNDSETIINLIDYEDGHEEPNSLRADTI